jgi:4-hydroxy-3-polyprenylbenzoate decarboxylase
MSNSIGQKRIMIGVTGASGSILAERLIEECLPKVDRIYLTITDTGRKVIPHELNPEKEGFSLARWIRSQNTEHHGNVIREFGIDDFFAPIASGTSAATDMVIVPCSMGTLARVAHGMSLNLLERSADVILKERRRLIIVPREAPLSAIHLENMLNLSRAGATILPPMPGFYQKPKSVEEVVDFIVGRIMESLGLEHELYRPWNSRMR